MFLFFYQYCPVCGFNYLLLFLFIFALLYWELKKVSPNRCYWAVLTGVRTVIDPIICLDGLLNIVKSNVRENIPIHSSLTLN